MALRAFGSIFALVEGDPRILALHGWGRRGSDFRAALNELGYLAPDLPGFGASPEPAAAIGVDGYASLLEPLLDSLGPEPILIGHSFGGRIAAVLAVNHPDRFAGLVLTGVPLMRRTTTRRSPVLYRLGRWAHRRSLFPDSAFESLRRRFGSIDYRVATGVMREILVKAVNDDYAELLPRLKPPVVLLWGADDREVPLTVAEAAAAVIPQADLRVVEGAGHLLPLSHPEELRRAVESLRR
ncbi:MAG: alpha/beta fold hydrolase [Acidimicrobiia bacterium]